MNFNELRVRLSTCNQFLYKMLSLPARGTCCERKRYYWRPRPSSAQEDQLMYRCVCKFGVETGNGEKWVVTFGREKTIRRWLKVRPSRFSLGKNQRGATSTLWEK